MTLYRTVHGSRLYGLEHETSDWDYYTVVANRENHPRKRYSKQTIRDGVDSTVIGLSTFMQQCYMGVPQALEALFSEEPEIDLITDFRKSYRVNTATTFETYRRTIKNFGIDETATFKKKRHAVRLALNLTSLLDTGRFNPRMTSDEIFIANIVAGCTSHKNYVESLEYLQP